MLRQRFAERLPEEERLAREIRAVVPGVAEILAREFGVRRVVLFGSIARGVAHPGSDIDLAVVGLGPALTLRAMTRCDDVENSVISSRVCSSAGWKRIRSLRMPDVASVITPQW